MICIFYEGLFLSILSLGGASGPLMECQGKISVKEFEECITKKSNPFVRNVSLDSYKQETYLNLWTSSQMIFPEDGSVGVKQVLKPTLNLNASFVYVFCLFDKDFLLFLTNPLLVPRSCVRISENISYFGITIKVCFNV